MIAGPLGGYLASLAFGATTAACGSVVFLLVPIAFFFLREPRQHVDAQQMLGNARTQLRNIATAKMMWAAAGLMALFYIAPGFSTALFYRQQDVLHLNTQTRAFCNSWADSAPWLQRFGTDLQRSGSVCAICSCSA